jgi:hypothetical protein
MATTGTAASMVVLPATAMGMLLTTPADRGA